jgi:hypothetical protein
MLKSKSLNRIIRCQSHEKGGVTKKEIYKSNNLKALLILIAIIVFGINAKSQDIILKQDGTEIKALVLELTDQVIKYKEYEFQDGPTRNIYISDVFMITYKNGQKEVFGNKSQKQRQNENQYVEERQPQSTEENPFGAYYGRSLTENYGYSFEGTDVKMNRSQYVKFLEYNSKEGYDRYKTGKKKIRAGVTFNIIGGVLLLTGVTFMSYGYSTYYYTYYNTRTGQSYYDYDYVNEELGIAGIVISGVGALMELCFAMPFHINGKKDKWSRSMNEYNEHCIRNRNSSYLEFKASPSRLGLTLNF